MKRICCITAALLILVTSAFAADFNPVFKDTILPHEGGYTQARNDPGNWTGGVVGKGKLLGTKYGIAANTYGVELLKKGKTIKGLKIEEARELYERDYWLSLWLQLLKSQGIAEELCDEAVNMGRGGGEQLLAKVFKEIEWATKKPVPVPPRFTRATIEWINEYTKERNNRVAFYNSIRLKRVKFYVNLAKHRPSMRPYILSWADRATD